MKRPKPKAKPPTVRQVLGRIEARCLSLENAFQEVLRFQDITEQKLRAIAELDNQASKRIDDHLATLRNQVENLRAKLAGDGVEHRINELHTGMSGLVIQAANKALVLLIQELERMGLKPQ